MGYDKFAELSRAKKGFNLERNKKHGNFYWRDEVEDVIKECIIANGQNRSTANHP